jgi:hypothetical protein
LDKESIEEAKRAIKGRRKQKDKEKQREEKNQETNHMGDHQSVKRRNTEIFTNLS